MLTPPHWQEGANIKYFVRMAVYRAFLQASAVVDSLMSVVTGSTRV
jgi:hypothetical protein